MDGKEQPQKESFGQFITKVSGVSLVAGVGLQFLEVPANLQQLAAKVIPFSILLFTCFVAIPAAINWGWNNRSKFFVFLRQLIKPKAEPAKMIAVETYQDSHQANQSSPSQDTIPASVSVINMSKEALSGVYAMLPANPNPTVQSSLTMETAGPILSDALQLAGFTIEGDVELLEIMSGPTLQSVTFQLPAKVQLSKLSSKRDDIANHLGHSKGFDIRSTTRFKSAATFVIPQQQRALVYLRDLASELQEFAKKVALPVVFGRDVYGKPVLHDLAKMPHLLIAGATGSGKSVCINVLLSSLLLTRTPDELRLLLIDPKKVELSVFNGYPHLLSPPITDMRRAMQALSKVIVEMERRYEVFEKMRVRNIEAYNLIASGEEKLPYIVVVIDEYADLMVVSGAEVEEGVMRITQMARAAGIHLILGTQRPSVDVVTGVIKANLPSRIAFKLNSSADYRTLLDGGAPHLLGYGDGVSMINGGVLERFQSASISIKDDESTGFLEALKRDWISKSEADRQAAWSIEEGNESEELSEERDWQEQQSDVEPETDQAINGPAEEGLTELSEYDRVLEVVKAKGGLAIKDVQKLLRCGFSEAAAYATRMTQEGIIGPFDSTTNMRPLIRDQQLDADEDSTADSDLLRMKMYICSVRAAKSADLQEVLQVRKQKIIEYMQVLVMEGFLLAPTSPRTGYMLAWSEERMDAFLQENSEVA
ncbi:FtsK/SpoIIIE domain-containing protein [Paenibacillus algorifonticola]|uniref:FtsK/SpoIIIE domain-containing protein n=1 Tax=Paenibacillus algorifonticola TaxID=684063 RepID=UPI003D26791F